ncbi:potassium channel family protein [Pseudomonas sp. SC11]|uniref:potassium channel family protein n=1 Tax=Pseudomonas sp. SC11 TaxID=326927 RepID=UPI00399C4798
MKNSLKKNLDLELSSHLTRVFARQKPFIFGVLYFVNIFAFGFVYRFVPDSLTQAPDLGIAMYFSVITATTLGYGDIAPKLTHPFMPLLVSLQVLIGVALIGFFLNALSHRMSQEKDEEMQALEKTLKEEQVSKALILLRPIMEESLHILAELYKYTALIDKPSYKVNPKDFLNNEFSEQINKMIYYKRYDYVNYSEPMYEVFIRKNNNFLTNLDKYLVIFAHALPVPTLVTLTNLSRHGYYKIPEMYKQLHQHAVSQGQAKVYPDDYPTQSADVDRSNLNTILSYIDTLLKIVKEIDQRDPENPITMNIILRNDIRPRVGAGLHPSPY